MISFYNSDISIHKNMKNGNSEYTGEICINGVIYIVYVNFIFIKYDQNSNVATCEVK